MSLFEMRDFAPPKPAHAEGCRYCHEDDNGLWTTREVHESEHLTMTCAICGESAPNRLLFEMNHFRHRGDWHPAMCTSLSLRLNHLTCAAKTGTEPSVHDLTALDLGWTIGPDGEQIPPDGWDERHAAGARLDYNVTERES